jgi:long-chain-fatty-acid--[acyl-carrier-protein] ligase
MIALFFWTCVSYVMRAILSLRYKVEVRGLDTLTPERLNRKGGILFLPNHPAHMDPLFNFVWLWPKFRMRPLVIEYIYQLKFMKPIHWLVGAIPVPDFSTGVNELKIRRGEKATREIAAGLKKGDNFILYPAGRLKNTGKELLGGASATHELLQECPDANVVLVRTTGLWGSSFSRAILGRSPDLGKMIVHGIKVVLKNLIFFTPRRKVLIEFAPNPKEMPRNGVSRVELNRYLENWYNRYPGESEPLKLVSYSFWKNEVPTPYKAAKKANNNNHTQISQETREKIYREIRRILDRPDLEIRPEQNIAFDLGMDSLNVAELIAYVTKSFHVEELHPEDFETVASVLEIAQVGKAREPKNGTISHHAWPEEKDRPLPQLPLGKTIPEALLNCADRMGQYAACGDDLSGVLSYKKLKLSALVLSRYFKKWEEERIAVLLPATSGTYLVIMAIQMAGKVPVMLNWTLGARYLEEMMKLSGAKRVVSSWRFLDRLQNVQFGSVGDQFVGLEDIRKKIGLGAKLKGLFLSKFSARAILKMTGLDRVDENDPCVVLFTSGTEAAPKGVPLSHKNIITNQRSAMQCIDLRATDVLYGILPPFHSFGFSVAGLFPILGGIRVAFYPDPTDSFALAEGIERWKVTFFCAAPSFLKGLFRAAKDEQLKTVRYFVSGAEKAPDELFARVAQLKNSSKLVEGYGITECSPILTLNRPHLPPKGVGRLAPDIEMIAIHPETLVLLPKGSEGEICVRGPNVFAGYLGNPRSPFIEIEGKKWYRTGDIGHLDPDGSLILSGRLKRFTKVGGEMISLGAIEEILAKALLAQKRISPDLPSLAICAEEKEVGRPRLILFTTIDIDTDEVNHILQEARFSNLVKVNQVKKIEEIPLMGAGKTDYRKLQSQI